MKLFKADISVSMPKWLAWIMSFTWAVIKIWFVWCAIVGMHEIYGLHWLDRLCDTAYYSRCIEEERPSLHPGGPQSTAG